MNFVKGRSGGCHNTVLQELALSDSDGADWINWFDALSDVLFQRTVKNCILYRCIGILSSECDDDLSGFGTHVLLNRSLNALLRDDQWLHSNQVTVCGDDVHDVVNLATVPANLTANVVGLVVVADESRQCILSNTFRHSESKDDVHLRKISAEFLLSHFVNTTDDMLIGFTDCFANTLEIPRVSRCSDGVPSLCLPLVPLLTCLCTCLCTDFLCHIVQLGSCIAGATPLALRPLTSPI